MIRQFEIMIERAGTVQDLQNTMDYIRNNAPRDEPLEPYSTAIVKRARDLGIKGKQLSDLIYRPDLRIR